MVRWTKNWLLLIAAGILVAIAARRWWQESDWPRYYQDLIPECDRRSDTSCCMASLQTMAQHSYLLAPPKGCPAGTRPNQMLCIDSLSWCEPSKR